MDTEALGSLQDEVRSAAVTALESLDESTSPADRRQAGQDAIFATLEENGVDSEELKTQLEVSRAGPRGAGRPHGGPHPAAASESVAAPGDAEPDQPDSLSWLLEIFPLMGEEV